MASNISTTNIDDNYPVAGQDNDSQGFRDNFQNIKTALTTAKTEITGLQDTRARVDQNNDFTDKELSKAIFVDTAIKAPTTSSVDGETTIDYQSGSYKRLLISGENPTVNIPQIINFAPSDSMTHVIYDVRTEGSTKLFTINNPSGNTIKEATLSFPFSIEANKRYIFEVWSPDSGTTLFVKYLGVYE
jgi:hypothetical protein